MSPLKIGRDGTCFIASPMCNNRATHVVELTYEYGGMERRIAYCEKHTKAFAKSPVTIVPLEPVTADSETEVWD